MWFRKQETGAKYLKFAFEHIQRNESIGCFRGVYSSCGYRRVNSLSRRKRHRKNSEWKLTNEEQNHKRNSINVTRWMDELEFSWKWYRTPNATRMDSVRRKCLRMTKAIW